MPDDSANPNNGTLNKLLLGILTAGMLGNGGFTAYRSFSHDPAPARQEVRDDEMKRLQEDVRELVKGRIEDRERLVRIETLLERQRNWRRRETGN